MRDSSKPPPKQTSLDRNQLRNVRENYLALNTYRLRFAQEIFPENQRLYLELLPALLHFNHPMLPGFCDRKTPAGVYLYQASEQTRKRLQRLAKSFHPNRNKNQRPDILSIFTMGSLGSSAQNNQSDIDVWLCHRTDLSAAGIALLEEKVKKITQWAGTFGVDTTIFLMNHQNFRAGIGQALDKESSGSTQHCLLLDEFYRTAIFLAGQLPIWLFITEHNTQAYDKQAQTLLEEKRLPDKQLIDFGTLESIPDGEFIGAAIWQLYKAIDSPYKAIIKLLLIEIYATHNQAHHFLANQFKHWLQETNLDQDISFEDYDPYFKTYSLIESYLVASNQYSRLELVRRCFYFKVAHPLTKNTNPYLEEKQLFIDKIIRSWGWDKLTINELNQRRHWKINTVNRERSLIINALNESYRFIIEFFRRKNTAISASNKELNILGRKLHAAFSKKAGKVEWINPGISEDISEEEIFILRSEKNQWLVKDRQQQNIMSKKSFIELLVNCHCNRVINKKTIINLDQTLKLPIEKIRDRIDTAIPSPLTPAMHQYFKSKCLTTKIIVFIHSFEKPDYFLIPDQPKQEAYYLNQRCSIDLMAINSWNEITCQQLEGRADTIIPKIFSQFLNEIRVFDNFHYYFFDENIAQALNTYIESLKQSLQYFLNENIHGQFIIKTPEKFICLCHSPAANPFTEFESIAELNQTLSTTHETFCALGVDQNTLAYSQLAVFAKHNRANCIQVFFEVKTPYAEVTIIDEQGSFYFLSIRYQNTQQSLLPIYAYCRAVNERRLSHGTMDVSPLDILPISIYELHKKNDQWRAEQVYLNNQASIEQPFSIHGFAEYKNHDFIFTLYCNEQRFSEEDEQAAAFKKMLNWMRSQSKGSESQPHYTIADLDISQCQQAFAPGQNLHTAHYLHVKTVLENKLRQAQY